MVPTTFITACIVLLAGLGWMAFVEGAFHIGHLVLTSLFALAVVSASSDSRNQGGGVDGGDGDHGGDGCDGGGGDGGD